MKKVFFLILLVPSFAWTQFKTVNFNADGFPLKVKRETISQDLTTLFGISKDFTFKLQEQKIITDKTGEQHFTYQQFYQGYLIESASIKLHFKGDQLRYINGEYLPTVSGKSFQKNLTEKQAFDVALQNAGAEKYIWDNPEALKRLQKNKSTELLFPAPHGQFVIYSPNARKDSSITLAYKFDIYATKPLSRNYVYVDATTGNVVGQQQRIHNVNGTGDTRYSGQRVISTEANGGQFRLRDYDSGRGSGIETFNLQTQTNHAWAIDFIDNDNDWTAAEFDNGARDNAALDAHWGAMMTYDYFFDVHGRNSIDNNGGVLQSFVHYGNNFENAFWDGTRMTYGDGNSTFNALTSIDIVAHEIGHGLCENSAEVIYNNDEQGAINEALSDIWGACIENFATTNKQTWLMFEDITISNPQFERSFVNPNSSRFPQPDTYLGDHWGDLNNDPHINSGVMNHWFFLLSEGGSGTNDLSNNFNVTGIGMNNAAAIVFRAETVYMTPNTDYADARTFTVQAAQDLFGNCSPEVISTINAWFAVGVGASYQTVGNLFITTNYFSPHIEDFYASNLLEASNTVGANTNIRYQSSGAVVLLPGFEAENGSNFVAEIVPCVDLSNAKKENNGLKVASNLASESFNLSDNLWVKIFPNPIEESFNVLFLSEDFTDAQITIADINNKLVKSFRVYSKISQVLVNDLAAGTYFVNILASGKTTTSKLIKN